MNRRKFISTSGAGAVAAAASLTTGGLAPDAVFAQASKKPKDEGKIDKDAWKKFFEKRVVVTGLSDNAHVEILKGLKTGEEIALEDPTLPNDKKKDNDD